MQSNKYQERKLLDQINFSFCSVVTGDVWYLSVSRSVTVEGWAACPGMQARLTAALPSDH